MADHHLDAKNKRLGRIASEIAVILQGKKSPDYEPRLPGSDKVFLKNFRDIMLTGNKFSEKRYYRHTGYMGHLKVERFEEAFEKDPKRVIREVVRHMLPKNFLNKRRIKNLVFIDEK